MVIRINLPGDYTRCGRWFKKDVGGAIGLGIFRSDYLLHCSNPDSNINEGCKGINGIGLEIKQVEFNMVSVSFAAPATKVSGLHRFLTGLTSKYTVDQLPRPPNCATRNLCKGREISHWAYRSTYSPEMPTAILMIFQPGERNVFDQTLLIYELDKMSSGPSDWNQMIRLPCDRILDQTRLDEDSIRLYYLIDGADRFEVSVIYYRSMYGPEEFMTEDHWLARYRLERSQLVKCSSLLAQLVGCKKFQQVLTDQNFVRDHLYLDQSGVMNEDEFEEIKSTWLDILDFDGGRSSLAYQLGTNHKSSTSYVLKPQVSCCHRLEDSTSHPDSVRELFVHNSHLYKCLVAFLGFGNGAPDVFSTFVAMRSGTGSLAIGELIGAASFIVSVVLGSMFLIKTFQVDQRLFTRDLGFFTLSILLIIIIITNDRILSWEANILMILYMIYVITVGLGTWYNHHRQSKIKLIQRVRTEFLDEPTTSPQNLTYNFLDDFDSVIQPQLPEAINPDLHGPFPLIHQSSSKSSKVPSFRTLIESNDYYHPLNVSFPCRN
ncbi:hypothetical protein PPACK8108_LOCUS7442 [Phakopsora pachyrhizi]|uniref:Sodium/calcium exchanger membrane region domain-containing protein n=1 Tax=Phakopsora pachyrhizi TaxID=170000 RepID=A0AAV0AVJ7_PHAPC|nr:hypothetical protein PPACK8108_LOCUS7442 [Phakopsora pachyrhizi]